ncbi:hypothetical protein NFI96_028728 [Prochilodus magdalenae]|nr:hypothetical protein NFI96_028728 [Prochilodus magdalenae]
MSMTNKGDDCYFFYYSTCTKGDSCPFRHCEAAMGSEIMCSLWQENRCFRSVCKFRHMEIKKNRKEIACYWENQPGGCQKPHCAFHHEKPRMIDGMYVPPDKGPAVKKEKNEETTQDDHVPSAPTPISNPTNPQLRGVMKSETQENVPSPTHPPVVINPVDDEDDEDDQVSEEGDEASVASPRKPVSSSKDDSLDFGIKTLEEIRLRKALKANLKRAGHPSSNGAGIEKENIQSLTQLDSPATRSESAVFEEPGKRKVTDRLGKRLHKDIPLEGDLPLKGSLAKRLGGYVDTPQNNPDMPPLKVVKSVRERLGTTPDLTAPKSPNNQPKPSGEIRIKTLEEIRQEKAAKSQLQHKGAQVVMEVPAKTLSSIKKGNRPVSGPQIKTFSELLHEKKQQKEENGVSQQESPEKSQILEKAVAVKVAAQGFEVRVKTLDEIRKEKAARMQAQAQETSSENALNSDDVTVKRRILRVSKNTQAAPPVSQKKPKVSEKKVDCSPNGKGDSSSQGVTVKSFEEIMREKRLRKQQGNQPTSASLPDQPSKKSAPALCEEKPPTVFRSRVTGPAATLSATESSNQTKASVQQRLGIKHQASSPVTMVIPERTSPEVQAEEKSFRLSPKKMSPIVAPQEQAVHLTASPGFNSQDPQMEKTQEALKTSSSNIIEMKVRPKLNVKPSVMKPAAQVKLGQRRKAAGTHCSAVAAVKPLNAVPTAEGEPPCKRIELSATVCSLDIDDGTPHMSAPVVDINPPSKPTTSVIETHSVPQSPVVNAPILSRARRQSSVSLRAATNAGSSATMDDFEELLDEFTDDKLEDELELDPGKGEDDLLLELSEMIDS